MKQEDIEKSLSLFIIGNGFDLAHGLHTSYRCFRKWLIHKYDLKAVDINIDKLRENISQNCEFKHIIDKIKEKFLTDNFYPYENIRSEEEQKFITDACQEWYYIIEDKMPNDKKEAFLNGMAKDTFASKSTEKGKKEAFFNGLKEAKYESLSKVLKKIGDDEWNQDNYDKALEEILKNDFGFELDVIIESLDSDFCYSKIIITDPKITASIIVTAIDAATPSNWDNFEDKLGNLNLNLFEKQEDEEIYDDFTLEARKILYRTILVNNLSKITEFFKEWIKSINVNDGIIKEKFRDEIKNRNCLFLNFNYTDTLELLYGIENVYYMHGNKYQEIILGHKEDADFSNLDDNMFKITLKKLTGWRTTVNKEFLSCLEDVTEIYSIGFSFNCVDMPYIKEICQNIDTKEVTWYLTKFDEDKKNNEGFKNKIYKELAELKTEGKSFPDVKFEIFNLEN